MSEEKPPTDEIDDAWLKRREDWCAALINKNTAAGYMAELMCTMCSRIRADGKRIEELKTALELAFAIIEDAESDLGQTIGLDASKRLITAALEDKTR